MIRILDKENALRTLDELGMAGRARDALRARVPPGPTAPCSSPARPARASRRRSTRRCGAQHAREEHHHDRGPGRVPDRRASTRCRSTRKAGLTFATGLRSILRADPDIIMVGEIRDRETAQIAIEAALTGHLVLSTLHTNDAPAAITRLIEMGIESFLAASAVDCVVAQRLARTLCPSCKRRTVVPAERARRGRLRAPMLDLEAYEPVGCSRCAQQRLPRPDRPLRGDGDERARSRSMTIDRASEPRDPRGRPPRREC